MSFRNKGFVVFAAVTLLSTPCLAFQSGSRNSASAASSGGFNAAPSSPSFSTPEVFSSPRINQPVVGNFQSPPTLPPSVIVDSSQNMPLSQPFEIPQSSSSVNMAAPQAGQSTSNASGSLGIPAASLVDPIFQISDPNSPYTIDHSTWNCFLSKYLVTDTQGVNRVRYGAVTQRDHNALKCYWQHLQSVDTRTLNRDEQLAFWINLYNARTIDLVLDNYPIRSIRQIKQKLTDFVGPFDDEGAVNVLGKSLSLNDIESGIVRPVWHDPRIHYALNCASLGCPNLSPTAWTAENIDGRLNGAAYQYINSSRAIKRGLRGVRISKIYKWYKSDFGGTDQAVLNHMRQYADGETLNKLCGQRNIAGHFYDWSLNDGKITRRRLLEPLIR